MEKNEKNLKIGKIYSIRSYKTDLFYIGSTFQYYLSNRLCGHRREYKAFLEKRKKKYVSSFEILKYADYYIELLEEYLCTNTDQLRKREGDLVRLNIERVVNKRIEGRTKKEYREDNKDKISEKKKEYRENNMDKISEHKKEYYNNNKERIKKKTMDYYNDNKTKIQNKRAIKILCECGEYITPLHKKRHEKTKKHLLKFNIKT